MDLVHWQIYQQRVIMSFECDLSLVFWSTSYYHTFCRFCSRWTGFANQYISKMSSCPQNFGVQQLLFCFEVVCKLAIAVWSVGFVANQMQGFSCRSFASPKFSVLSIRIFILVRLDAEKIKQKLYIEMQVLKLYSTVHKYTQLDQLSLVFSC